MRHIISVLLENESGALSRVSGLFSARGFNIESLTVATTNDQSLSRLTVVTVGSDSIVDQIIKQLSKLIDVVSVTDLTLLEHIERELMLLKVKIRDKADIDSLLEKHQARCLKVVGDVMTIEIVAKAEKVDAFLKAFDLLDIIEVARTGVTGIEITGAV